MLTLAACDLTPAPVPAATNSNAGASAHGKQKGKGSSGDGSTAHPEDRAKASAEEWDGRVPRARIVVTASRSSGAGGQNVNKVSTKAEIRFTVKEVAAIVRWSLKSCLPKTRECCWDGQRAIHLARMQYPVAASRCKKKRLGIRIQCRCMYADTCSINEGQMKLPLVFHFFRGFRQTTSGMGGLDWKS